MSFAKLYTIVIINDLMDIEKILNSGNEEAIDALIEYWDGQEYDDGYDILQLANSFDPLIPNLNILTKLEAKQIRKINLILENIIYNGDDDLSNSDLSGDFLAAFEILSVTGESNSLDGFKPAIEGACLWINRRENPYEDNWNLQGKICEVIAKILNGSDPIQILEYLNKTLQDDWTHCEECAQYDLENGGHPSGVNTWVGEFFYSYEYYDNFLSFYSSLLDEIKSQDKNIISVIKRIRGKIDVSRKKYPMPKGYSR